MPILSKLQHNASESFPARAATADTPPPREQHTLARLKEVGMSRWVVPSHPGLVAGTKEGGSDWQERYVKYVPAEIVAPFTGLMGIAATLSLDSRTAQSTGVILILLFLGVTFVRVRRAPAGIVRRAHLIAAPVAFLAWAYPISSALLRDWFVGLISLLLQAIAVGLALAIAPHESA
jgi:hypothetical protein